MSAAAHSGFPIFIVLLVVAAVAVGAFFVLRKKHHHPSPAPAARYHQQQYQQQQQQQYRGSQCQRAAAAQGGAPMTQGLYQSTGPLMPNTYTFSTLGPKYGTGMGAIFDSLQPSTSNRAQFAGQFMPPELGNPRCG